MVELHTKSTLLSSAPPLRQTRLLGTGSEFQFPADQRNVGGLSEILHLLGRFKFRLLISAVVGLCAGGAISLISPARYQARVALQIQNPNADFLNARAVNSVAEASAADSGSLTDVATEIKIMESNQLLDRVITKLRTSGQAGGLEARATHRSILARLENRAEPTGDALIYKMREIARPDLSVKQIGPTRAVEILYSDSDPAFASELANTLAQQYIDMSEESRWSKSRHTEESLSRELEEVRGRLRTSQDALQKYAANSGLLFVSGQHASADDGDISESKLGQLQAALSQADADRAQAQSHYEVARTADPEDVGDVLNDQRLRELREKLTDLRRQRAELATTYTDDNDKVRRVAAQIAPLEAEALQQRNSILNRIQQDYYISQRRERLLQHNYQDQVGVVVGKEAQSVQYSILKQDVDSNQRLYESVLEQVRHAGIASAVRSNNIEIFDPAKPPIEPYSPRPVMLSGLGIFGGLLAASLFTLFTESSDRRVQVAGDLQERLPLRELGVIPAHQPETRLRLQPTKAQNEVHLVSWTKRLSLADEAYRALLTSILYSDEDGPAPRVIVVTSPNPGEGKTTTACNLAILMAELNQRVLLVDGDSRRPHLHKVFGIPPRLGLSNLLKDARLRANDLVHSTFVPNLFVLPSGMADPDPSKLLNKGRLATLMQEVRDSFDVVLIDTCPSLLAADARILGRNADAVVIVTRAGCTTSEEVVTTVKNFAADGTRILGTVLNDMKLPRSLYNYYAANVTAIGRKKLA